MNLPSRQTSWLFKNSNIWVQNSGVFAVMYPWAVRVTFWLVLFCLGGLRKERAGLEDMLNANISPPVSRALAETIGWILFDMDE